MPFVKGQKGLGGRRKGVPNRLTKSVKQSFEAAFRDLQADEESPAHLLNWARENTTDFYKIAAKLIPEEVTGNVSLTVQLTKYDR